MLKIALLDKHAIAGLSIFVPALTVLANREYATSLVHALFPHVSSDNIGVIVTPCAAYAAFLLLKAQSPTTSVLDVPEPSVLLVKAPAVIPVVVEPLEPTVTLEVK